MAGPIQGALSSTLTTASAVAVAGKKMYEDEKQAVSAKSEQEKAQAKEAEAKAKQDQALLKEAKDTTLEADLVRMGADPESAHAYMNARELGLDTKSFGMIRKKGKFVGSYSSLADKLSKDSLTDSFSSKVLNEKGFSDRVLALGGNRKARVQALVEASKGGKK